MTQAIAATLFFKSFCVNRVQLQLRLVSVITQVGVSKCLFHFYNDRCTHVWTLFTTNFLLVKRESTKRGWVMKDDVNFPRAHSAQNSYRYDCLLHTLRWKVVCMCKTRNDFGRWLKNELNHGLTTEHNERRFQSKTKKFASSTLPWMMMYKQNTMELEQTFIH